MFTRSFRCMCNEDHEIVIERVGDEVPVLYIADRSRLHPTWKDKLRVLWKILRYGQCEYTEILLDTESANQLAESILTASGFVIQEETRFLPVGEILAMSNARRCD